MPSTVVAYNTLCILTNSFLFSFSLHISRNALELSLDHHPLSAMFCHAFPTGRTPCTNRIGTQPAFLLSPLIFPIGYLYITPSPCPISPHCSVDRCVGDVRSIHTFRILLYCTCIYPIILRPPKIERSVFPNRFFVAPVC
ncbi:hypothetical protein BDV98DRAFT_565367 [Pterulicium gracile]|uniref:Uncharacterized protein n=1 Tax=Pterulicium gracile TaxID=1884261 RepID=A0A5C3QMC0_9AGAR|nr:hypothetical protein BDV98DRAFT_565367 [Pterula gracilis]